MICDHGSLYGLGCVECSREHRRDAARYRALRDNEKVRAHVYKRDSHHCIVELERGAVLDERIDLALRAAADVESGVARQETGSE